MRIWYMIVFVSVWLEPVLAQNTISTVALVKKDSIILRWVPSSIPVWQTGVKYGYLITRYTIAKDGEYITDGLQKGILLTRMPVKPEKTEMFDSLASEDKRALIVQEAIYGKDFQPVMNGDFNSLRKLYDELEVRFGFALFICDMSPGISRAAGLSFTDRDISEKDRYVYSVSLAYTPDGLQTEPSVIVVDAEEITKLPAVSDVQALFLDKIVKFKWPVVFHKGIYSAYSIERSTDGRTFLPVSELPLVNFSENDDQSYFMYTDSLADNDQQVFYRIKGITPFGESGPNSDVIKGKGKPDFPGYATIDTAFVTDKNRITIKWRISESAESPVIAINVLRSDSYNGSFEILNRTALNARSRSFTDENPGVSNYYQVMIKGKDDLSSYSFPYFIQTEDNDPPGTPELLYGTIDSSGVVSIGWKKNSDPDLLGYKIFRGNSPEEFIPLYGIIQSENTCRDTVSLNSLSQKLFYRVIAVDKNYNSSDYSTALELSMPDTIPPAPALINRIDYSEGKIIIQLEGSPSNDISSYDLYLKTQDDTTSVLIKSWEKILPVKYEYVPSDFGKNLHHSLITIDKSSNRSENSRTIFVPSTRQRYVTVKSTQSPDGTTIRLQWEIPDGFIPVKTIIYRSAGEEPISMYYAMEKPDQYFTDKNIEIGIEYSYRIVIYSETESIGSQKVLLNNSKAGNK